ncbi:reverse transcriptase [Gossypium australe]|uniref:Reverse transcriptase n=1 Tax=Gossypium australe TaxID=47621 RepID=A0A5B6U8E9_9ROSI|nr:reverse transcriptase [Gossypium australe]
MIDRQQRGNTYERLDRALANDAWISAFPHSLVYHLPHIKSDHRPILLKTRPTLNVPRGRPFRFLAGWTEHANFKDLVSSKWRYSGNMAVSLSEFTSHVKDWDRDTYGYIGTRKRQLLRSLGNIQKAMDQSTSRRLANLEVEVRDELENVLNHEELLWRQKARCDWLQFGDKNTKFFHRRTMQRRKFNCILALHLSNGEWCSEQDILSDEAVKFLENLYGENPSPMYNIPSNIFPSLEEQDIDFLKKAVTNDEIKKALFNMAPLKASGSDGYHAHFYQSQWDLVGGAVCEWVQGIFDGNSFEEELNNSLIVLISKKECPDDFSQFRPISLCSVLYKLVMKVIANRFKVVFPNYIFPEQAGFIAGRNISDNVIIAHEVIHFMRSRKGDKKWLAIKLDLEKAYDKVSWKFIEVSLVAIGIPKRLRKVIMNAISSSPMQILWNRVPSRSFKPVRGIRQGCPLSPYLFILCMELLGYLINSEIKTGRYLGVPLFHDRVTKSTLNFVIEKVRSKLQNWDARKLSLARRITLAQSIFLAIPGYFMQSLAIPKGVCDSLEKIVREFIWGGSAGNPKIALVGWESICQPKTCGGLGFRHLQDHNNSFLMKISFNLVSRKDALWVQVQVRNMDGRISFLSLFTRDSARIFGNIYLRCGLSFVKTLCGLLGMVLQFVLPDGSWNIDMLHIWLSEDILKRVVSIPPPHLDGGEDRIIWARSGSSSFSIRSTYWTLKENSWRPKDDNWKIIWKYQGPQRVRIFLWLVTNQRLLTNSERSRRGIAQSSACQRCDHNLEDIMHVLCDCLMAKEAWMLVVPPEKQSRFFFDPLQTWLTTNLSCHLKLQDKGINWSCLFRIMAWRIWKNMNLFIFQNIHGTSFELVKASLSWAQNFESIIIKPKVVVIFSGAQQHCFENWIHLSSDGAVARMFGNAAAGGVVRDRDGNWILGYTHYMGSCSPLEAELWSILDGVLTLMNKGYKRVKIQTDNLEVVRLLSTKDVVDSENTLLKRVKRLLYSVGQWEIKHVPRECNLTADQLAKIGLSWQTSLRIFEVPPDVVVTAFLQVKAFNVS